MNSSMTERLTQGVHHVGLTVPYLDSARDFFVDALGFETVGEVPDYPALFVSDGTVMITLWRAKDPAHATPFNRHGAIGLHHLALKVENEERLQSLHARLQARSDVSIEFAPEPIGAAPLRHMMCLIPGGIRVEFTAPAS